MKSKILHVSIFVLSIIGLIISIKLFYNIGIYADEFNTSPDIVLGGKLALFMDWVRLACSALLAALSGINLFHKK